MVDFTNEERQYLRNVLQSRLEDGSKLDSERLICNDIFNLLRSGNSDLTQPQITYLQQMLQEQSEIYGRSSSTANEKGLSVPASFTMQKQVAIIVSIAKKLGATFYNNQPPAMPTSPRSEGSRHIMIDPTQNEKFQ